MEGCDYDCNNSTVNEITGTTNKITANLGSVLEALSNIFTKFPRRLWCLGNFFTHFSYIYYPQSPPCISVHSMNCYFPRLLV